MEGARRKEITKKSDCLSVREERRLQRQETTEEVNVGLPARRFTLRVSSSKERGEARRCWIVSKDLYVQEKATHIKGNREDTAAFFAQQDTL